MTRFIVVIAVLGFASSAFGERVVAERSYWNSARTRIHTDLVIEGDDGAQVRRTVPGGSVGGIGMITFELLEAGQKESWELAYVRTRARRGGPSLRWSSGCVYITPDSAGSNELPGDREHQILREVLDHWQSQTRDCAYLTFLLEEPQPLETGYDGMNTIKFREDRWCSPASGDQPETCYSSAAAAITEIFFVDDPSDSRDGLILDSDISMNSVNFEATDGPSGRTGKTASDLANTLTHEIGHLIGLEHTCWNYNTPNGTDDEGNEVPDCSFSLPSELVNATMFAFQANGETKKRTIELDDRDGFCGIYPIANDPGSCERALAEQGGCCSVAGRASDTPGAGQIGLILGALGLTLLRRRRP